MTPTERTNSGAESRPRGRPPLEWSLPASRERAERRAMQRLRAEIAALAAERIERRANALRRRRWPGLELPEMEWLLRWHCAKIGREKGGRPPAERRCTKRLGSRLCWNWRVEGTDRCRLHTRGGPSARQPDSRGRRTDHAG